MLVNSEGLVNLHTLDLSDTDIGNNGLRFLTGKFGSWFTVQLTGSVTRPVYSHIVTDYCPMFH